MTINHVTQFAVLATLAVFCNADMASRTSAATVPESGGPCQTGPGSSEDWLPGEVAGRTTSAQPLMLGCLDCVLYATSEEDYCQSRNSDCDGLLGGIEESYYWTRMKKLYECQDGEEENLYVDCTYWDITDCCNNGSTGVPPTDCSHTGTTACAARIIE